MTGFPTRRPAELEDRPPDRQWLVEGLWGRQAVGIIGGEPKCGKSFLALDLAVAVAAGVPCLRRSAKFASCSNSPEIYAAHDPRSRRHRSRGRLVRGCRAGGGDLTAAV